MANTGPPRTTGKATVGDQCDTVAQTETHQGRSRSKHLPHSWATFGPLVTNNHQITGNNLPTHKGLHSTLFRIETAGTAFEVHHLLRNAGLLDDGTKWREVTEEDGEATFCPHRVTHWLNHVLIHSRNTRHDFLDSGPGQGRVIIDQVT